MRAAWTVAWVVASWVPAVAAAEDLRDPPGADAKAPLAGTVLVWRDAAVSFDPEQPGVKLATLDRPRKDKLGAVVAMRVVSVRGDVIEVEPSTSEECTEAKLLITTLQQPRLLVSRADLAPVVTKRFATKFGDGTEVTLEVGLPVVPRATGGYLVPIDGEAVPVDLPASHVGHAYRRTFPKTVLEVVHGKQPVVTIEGFRMDEKVTAKLGAHSFATTSRGLTFPIASKVDRKGDTALFPLRSRCARATVALASNNINAFTLKPPSLPGLVMGRGGSGRGGDYLRRGTPMFAGKRKVGTLAEEEPVKQTTCVALFIYFELQYIPNPSTAKVEVCAPASTKLVHREGLGELKLKP